MAVVIVVVVAVGVGVDGAASVAVIIFHLLDGSMILQYTYISFSFEHSLFFIYLLNLCFIAFWFL